MNLAAEIEIAVVKSWQCIHLVYGHIERSMQQTRHSATGEKDI